MKEKKNTWKIIAIAFLLVSILTISVSAYLFTLTKRMKFRVEAYYGLELREIDGVTVVPWEIDFGTLPNDGNKTLTYRLYNTGNNDQIITWEPSAVLSSWEFKIYYGLGTSGAEWISGNQYLNPKGTFVEITLFLREIDASSDVEYQLDLMFHVVS